MKLRILYPIAFLPFAAAEPLAGSIMNVDDRVAAALIAEGAAEPVDAKGQVEQATAAPGEKRRVGRPRKIRP